MASSVLMPNILHEASFKNFLHKNFNIPLWIMIMKWVDIIQKSSYGIRICWKFEWCCNTYETKLFSSCKEENSLGLHNHILLFPNKTTKARQIQMTMDDLFTQHHQFLVIIRNITKFMLTFTKPDAHNEENYLMKQIIVFFWILVEHWFPISAQRWCLKEMSWWIYCRNVFPCQHLS